MQVAEEMVVEVVVVVAMVAEEMVAVAEDATITLTVGCVVVHTKDRIAGSLNQTLTKGLQIGSLVSMVTMVIKVNPEKLLLPMSTTIIK